MGTYLDEIHTVHTRGANSVDLYVIAGYQYMAIAQAVDSAGNSEVLLMMKTRNGLNDL